MTSTTNQPIDHRGAGSPTTERRSFLAWISLGLSAIAGALVTIPFVGYLIPGSKDKALWVKLGRVDEFALDQTRMVTFDNPLRQPWDGVTSQTGVFVRNRGGSDAAQQFLVLSVNCAHLGCPVTWFPQSELFLCPCHGGVYYADGSHASGPPPRGMFHCVWRVRDGLLEVRAPHYPTLQNTLEQTA